MEESSTEGMVGQILKVRFCSTDVVDDEFLNCYSYCLSRESTKKGFVECYQRVRRLPEYVTDKMAEERGNLCDFIQYQQVMRW